MSSANSPNGRAAELVDVECDACGHKFQASSALLGTVVHCPKCKTKVRLPASDRSSHLPLFLAASALAIAVAALLVAWSSASHRSLRTLSPSPAAPDGNLEGMRNRVDEFAEALKRSGKHVNALQVSLARVRTTADNALSVANAAARVGSALQNRRSWVTLDPTAPGPFASLQTSNGTLLVSLSNVEPYLNGMRLILQVGNPMMCTYSRSTMRLRYGPRGSLQPRNIKEVSIIDPLLPGRWNRVEAVIAPLGVNDLGALQVSIETTTVSLQEAPKP